MQQYLYFFPLPQGQGSLRPTLGQVVFRYKKAIISRGPYVHGERHELWTEGYSKGPLVNGMRHGSWVVKQPVPNSKCLRMESGEYVNGALGWI